MKDNGLSQLGGFEPSRIRRFRGAHAARVQRSAARRPHYPDCVGDVSGFINWLTSLRAALRGAPPRRARQRPALPMCAVTSASILTGTLVLWCLSPIPARAESLLLTGATIHTVSGPVLTNGQVLIKDGKIEAIDKSIKTRADKTVKLDGLHLYPGLIAASTSLGLVEIDAVRATRDMTEVGDYTPDVESWIAVNPDSELLPVARANGITHVLPVPTGSIVAGQSGLIQLDGWTMEEMTVRKPVALHVFWPGMTLNTTPREEFRDKSRWKSLEDQAKDRRAKLKELADFFDEAKAYAKARDAAGKDGAKPAEIVPAWEAMLPYVRGELPLMVHADELRQIKSAVQWADTNAYKIIIAGGRDAWKVAGLLAEKKVPVIFECTFNQGNGLASTAARDTTRYDVYFTAPSILHKAGAKVIFSEGLGGDGATTIRNLPYSAAQAAAFGLPEDEALKGITLYPAEVLGIADRLGSIEVGKEATLFAATKGILDIRSNVKRMWIAGKEVGLESRHTRLYEKYRNRPKPE
jgi:imidazolonepropionase-like amidohydrolase